MRPVFCSLLLAALAWTPDALLAQEGRLQKVREEVCGGECSSAGGQAGKKEKKDRSRKGGESCDDDDSWLSGEVALAVLLAPFVLPAALLGDTYENRGYFLRHPYQNDLPGFMRMDGFLDEGLPPDRPPLDPAGLKWWMGRLSLFEGNDFDGLNRVNGQLLLDTSVRFGLQTDWMYLNERLGGRHDDMVLGDMNLTFRFAQTEYVQMRAGLGARVLADAASRWGFNFTYGADLFPARPLVLSAVVDLGTVGAATVYHFRATAGVTWQGWELFAGYDFLAVGSVDLQGPLAGLRFWF